MTDRSQAVHGGETPPHASIGGALANAVAEFLPRQRGDRWVIGVAGESGSGKSTTAAALARALDAKGHRSALLHQDDYFIRPPRTNHEARIADLTLVGPHEVNLALLQAHIAAFRAGRAGIAAPRVDYPGNRFVAYELDFAANDVLIVEGTYVLMLDDIDARVFLSATHRETSDRRAARARDIDDPLMERILDIEHRIIAPQRDRADVIIDAAFAITKR
jgi:uridine kinase